MRQDLVRDLADDAKALKCEAELRHVLEIVRNGSGADRQVDLFRLRRLEGASHDEALTEVVDLIIRGDERIPRLKPPAARWKISPWAPARADGLRLGLQ